MINLKIPLLFLAFVILGQCYAIDGEHSSSADPDSHYSDFGGRCKSSLECNPESGLTCLNNICACDKVSSYDKKSKKCYLRVGAPCKPRDKNSAGAACPTNTVCDSANTISEIRGLILPKSLVNAIPALIHGDSGSRYVCKCTEGWTLSGSRAECVPVLTHGKSCAKKSAKGLECDKEAGLHCDSEEVCSCADHETVYDKKLLKCSMPVGANCKLEQQNQCEEGSVCSLWLYYLRYITHVYGRKTTGIFSLQDIYTKNGTCVCAPGLTVNSKNKCVGNFRVACSVDSPCNTEGFLECIDGICMCGKGGSQIFDGTSCRIPVGSACAKKGPKCIGNSTCADGHCTLDCADGSESNPTGECLRTHGTSCDTSAGEFCDNSQGLACVASQCACFDTSLKWNKKKKMCMGTKDEKCGKFKISDSDIFSFSTSDPLYALGPLEVEYYMAGCADELTCQYDGFKGQSFCK